MDNIDYFNRKDKNDNIDYFDRKDNNGCILHNCGLNLTTEQKNIITTNHDNIMVNGVPGSAKTTTLVLRQAYKITQSPKKQNTIFLTKVSNVTEELVKRLQKFIPDIKINYARDKKSNRVTAEYNHISLEFSNYDAFIDCQLKHYTSDQNYPDYLEYEKKGELYNICVSTIPGDKFDTKRDVFDQLAKENKLTFKLKNGEPIHKIILDEVQDFPQTTALVFLSIINNNEISFEGYGDILQSIWYKHIKDEELNKISNYPINIFRTIKDIKLMSLSTSFRLPWWHGEFLRIIHKDANKLYCRDEIKTWKEKPTENKDLHKIMYFMHGEMSYNESANNAATTIYKILTTIWNNDKDVTHGDTTIISTNINDNNIFNKLDVILNKNNIPVVFYRTKSGDSTDTIDMNLLKEDKCSKCGKKFTQKSTNCKKCETIRKRNKVALISGHGFKGGEGKLVVVFGLSEKALPKENRPNTPNELTDISLMEVVCSRSEKYKFIGSNHSPTRYITNNMLNLSNALYLVQDFQYYLDKEITNVKLNGQFALSESIKKLNQFYKEKKIDEIKNLDLPKTNDNKHLQFLKNVAINDIEKPEIYNKVSQTLIEYNNTTKNYFNTPLCKLLKITNATLNTPDRNNLSVTDITEKCNKYSSTDDIIKKCIKIETETFGKPSSIEYTNVDASALLGNLPNIKISIHNDYDFCECLKRIIDNQNVLYIDEDGLGAGLIDILKDNFYWYNFLEGLDRETIMDKIRDNPKYIVDLFGNRDSKQILLPNYFSGVFNDMELNTNTKIWNKCLLYEYIYSDSYVQSSYKIDNDNEYFTGYLENAMRNIDFFIDNEIYKDIKLEASCNVKSITEKNEEILEKKLLFNRTDNSSIFSNGYKCSIKGRADAYTDKQLHEFKMSISEKCKEEWILQVLLYSEMGIQEQLDPNVVAKKVFFRNATLYNFITGKKYIFKIDLELFKKKYKKIFYDEVLNSFNYIPCLKDKFLDAIIID